MPIWGVAPAPTSFSSCERRKRSKKKNGQGVYNAAGHPRTYTMGIFPGSGCLESWLFGRWERALRDRKVDLESVDYYKWQFFFARLFSSKKKRTGPVSDWLLPGVLAFGRWNAALRDKRVDLEAVDYYKW